MFLLGHLSIHAGLLERVLSLCYVKVYNYIQKAIIA